MKSLVLLGTAIFGLSTIAGAQESASTKEQDKLQGVWYNVSAELDGKQQTGEDKSNLHIIKGDRVITEIGGEYVQESIFTLEPGEKFDKITFQMMSGPDKGKTWVGIYQLDGEILKWCGSWKGDTGKLPSNFTTKEGDLYFLRVMKLSKR
jgi:uncharacterized protein (TIGR03067 family)